jgi:hypothetical protein
MPSDGPNFVGNLTIYKVFSYAIFFTPPNKGTPQICFFVDIYVLERMRGALLLIMVCMGTPSRRV